MPETDMSILLAERRPFHGVQPPNHGGSKNEDATFVDPVSLVAVARPVGQSTNHETKSGIRGLSDRALILHPSSTECVRGCEIARRPSNLPNKDQGCDSIEPPQDCSVVFTQSVDVRRSSSRATRALPLRFCAAAAGAIRNVVRVSTEPELQAAVRNLASDTTILIAPGRIT
jgi:hypothetical protein